MPCLVVILYQKAPKGRNVYVVYMQYPPLKFNLLRNIQFVFIYMHKYPFSFGMVWYNTNKTHLMFAVIKREILIYPKLSAQRQTQ